MSGPSLAPPLVRAALHCPSTNLSTECGGDLEDFADDGRLVDVGDLVDIAGSDGLLCIRRRAEALRAAGYRVAAVGGDHAVTLPLVQACADLAPQLTLVHLDAHPDLYEELDGDRFSHACPFARIMEAGGALRLLQVGIRTCNAHQRQQARRWPVEMFYSGSRLDTEFPKVTWPAYLSVDLDVLDPAFAPGVSHHEPGGLTTRDVISLIHTLQGVLVGADVVEYNPRQDLNGVTGRVAAKLVKEILGSMLSDG